MAGVLVVAMAGCVSVPALPRALARQRLDPELAHHYDYSKVPLQAAVDSAEEKSGYRIQHLRLAPANSSEFRPIRLDWYRPTKPGRLPVVLLSPILAGNSLYVREFAGFYAARGMHALIVYRPKEVFSPDRELKDVETHFQESVIQLRQTIDWLETQESVDAARIGSYGISLGAILTTILAAVEPRVKAHVLGLPAGHIAEIIMASQDKTIRKRRRAYLEKRGWSRDRGLQELQAVIVSDPLRFAPGIDPSRVLVIAAIFDRVLGFHRSLELWRALGKPTLVLLPTGHYTAAFATPYLKIVTYSFFKRRLHAILIA